MKESIKDIKARQILDSRGNPTIEVDVITESGVLGRAQVPSGASTGKYEAVELRDGDKKYYNGKSVLKAVNNVNGEIKKSLVGISVFNQNEIDKKMIELDGTKNKSRLGANAILGVSLACVKAAANVKNMPLYEYVGNGKGNLLPVPMMNIINGGKHADNNVNVQEFMILPIGAKTFSKALQMCAEVYQNLKSILKKDGYTTAVGDEGGFAPNFENDEQALMYMKKAIESVGYSLKEDFGIGIDAAATEMFNEAEKIGKKGSYYFWKTKQLFSCDQMIDYWENLIKKYNIITLEDALSEEDFEGWQKLNQRLGSKTQIVGDDLFVTNAERLQKGIELNLANSVLIKLNQIGTLTETIETINIAKKAGYTTVISHRSGETEDTTIADLSVALNLGQIKSGAPCRVDRIAKYNQLLRIEESLGKKAKYIGKNAFKNLK